MPAGGFRTFVAGEVLDEDDVNDYLMQGVLVFGGSAVRGTAIGTAVEGMVSFLTDSDTIEFYDGSDWVVLESTPPIPVDALIIGSGGGGGWDRGGGGAAHGGGAGGYVNTVDGEASGGGSSALSDFAVSPGETLRIVIGAGGAKSSFDADGGYANPGNSTIFGPMIAPGGGGGGNQDGPGQVGGSGGGGQGGSRLGMQFLGFAGESQADFPGGGGGGAGENGGSDGAGHGGDGLASAITGASVTRAGGGAGGGGTPGNGGGGSSNGDGAANTGGGGGGGNGGTGGNGGSGVVIFRVPTGTAVSFSAGVSSTSATVGGNTVYTVTATSTTSETVTIGS